MMLPKEGGKGVSLNDCLHVGPPLTPQLYDVLVRFREKRIAIVGDIEKAFLNVEVAKKDRDSLRFLWVDDISSKEIKPVEYRFCRVVFGVNCSPFLLNATVQYHLDTFAEEDPQFVESMKRSLYVDDWVGGHNSYEGALKIFDAARSRMAKGGFRLRKWLTNDPNLRAEMRKVEREETASVNVEDDQSYAKATLGNTQDTGIEKVLGMKWDCTSDEFIFSFEHIVERAEMLEPTKRNVLSILASLYDPLGLVSPVVVSLKVLFQELCADKVSWDQGLSGERLRIWEGWISELKRVKEMRFPRCVYGENKVTAKNSLIGFADASSKAYCTVIYFVSEFMGEISVTLLTSKTRVAPLSVQTVPRLELMAARTLAYLMDTVKNALANEVNIDEIRLWSDSKTVLCWLENKKEWKTFVRHRVNEILKITTKSEWGYCPSKENPADIGSRGLGADSLQKTDLWWNGPGWLSSPREGWPSTPEGIETDESTLESKKGLVLTLTAKKQFSPENIINIQKYSKINKLYRVTAYVKRSISNIKAKKRGVQSLKGELSAEEIVGAERVWILAMQDDLKQQDTYVSLSKELQIVNYNGILRCKGRLSNSDLGFEGRQPILLPRKHRLTTLIIEDCHRKTYHSGLRATLAELRSRYWVPRGRQTVKKVIRDCLVCKRVQGKSFAAQPVADLPEFRVKQDEPFSKVGIDFAGPLFVEERGEMSKCYITVFSCCITRGIHLELVPDLTTATFLNCFRRFTARRGIPSLILADNAKTFKAADNFLGKLYEDEKVKEYISRNRIQWRYILAKSPWVGGFMREWWEQ